MGINQHTHKQLYGLGYVNSEHYQMIEPLQTSSMPNIHLELVNRRSLKNIDESRQPKKKSELVQKTKMILLFDKTNSSGILNAELI